MRCYVCIVCNKTAINEVLEYDMKSDLRVHVQPFEDWMREAYGQYCEDPSTLYSILHTNPAYAELAHPCKAVERENGDGSKSVIGYVPDFKYRYLTEDVPYGMLVLKGLAQLVGVRTPIMDRVLKWCQSVMGKTYLNDKGHVSLECADVQNSRTPQALGFKSIHEVLRMTSNGSIGSHATIVSKL